MVKLTKRMLAIRKKVNKTKKLNVDEVFAVLKELATANFIESVDVAISLNINIHKSQQNVRGSVMLPYGTGRFVRVAVFAKGSHAKNAQESGADVVGMEDLAEEIKKGRKDFDVVISSPEAMPIVGQVAQILGPRHLMPNPKMGTVTEDIAKAVKNAKAGQIYYRSDRGGIVHSVIGKVDFESHKLKENLCAFLIGLKKSRPSQVKGAYIKKINISTTMGVGFSVEKNSLRVLTNPSLY